MSRRRGRRRSSLVYGGSAVDMTDWIDAADAVLMAWYPGEEGGRAVADVLWGEADPSGQTADHLPPLGRPAPARLRSQADGPARRLPRPDGGAALPLRLRLELYGFPLCGPRDRAGNGRARRDGPRIAQDRERRPGGRGGGRPALHSRSPGLGHAAGPRAQGIPEGLPGAGRVGDGDVRPGPGGAVASRCGHARDRSSRASS